MSNDYIRVFGARERNLKNIDVEIPKKEITVFTGVSGSGKSSLVFDTIAAESQRQLNQTYTSFIRHRMPHYGKSDVDTIENLSVAFIINQKRIGGNARSTVVTITDIYSLLRLLFSRIGEPFVGYTEVFSFNNPAGMCSYCQGLGKIETVDIERLLDKNKSLNDGAIYFPTFEPGGWRLTRYIHSGFFDNNKIIQDYSTEELELLLYADGIKVKNPAPEWHKTSLYEGLIPRIERSFLKKEDGEKVRYSKEIERFIIKQDCPHCHGTRLSDKVLSCKVNGKNIAECADIQINELLKFIQSIKDPIAVTIVSELLNRLQHIVSIGLDYLSLSRETSTLSGGESQRIKMVCQLGSSLTDLTYIFDEPSIGLHPHDISKINDLMKLLRDKGNTVLIVEHDPDMIKIADHVIDMGPGAGTRGGEIIYQGNLQGLKTSDTLTGNYLSYRPKLKIDPRSPKGWLSIHNATLHNLKNLSVELPKGVMTVVTGVAGSGKSTLINQVLPHFYPETVFIDQKGIQASKRSNLATFTNIFDIIRKLFAKSNGVSASLFSFNSQGACPVCKGLGVTYTDLAFMDTIVTVCEECHGNRYTDEVLAYKLRDKNISDILKMTVSDALEFFQEREIIKVLQRLSDVGITYISLGQPLNTLSGGELQRIKLATELENNGQIYVLDEPSTGLHMADIKQLIGVMNRLVEQNSTLIVIEHNLDIICQADWIIDLGPYAGQNGGNIMFTGLPKDLMNFEDSLTGHHLRKYIMNI
ncbi:ATP-binding cassette domain-containing protein [Lachnoclostridium phytofermentans]|uniref:UvrABC system protein A n=1 Tax=Lachnoclostridium phytofermentans (strain ATCC 700394 / DSM 18823 / ISDg) TaxID=357809 RepID=A9KHR3_LACP7|nr:excinuclease ABC subunit UvrA [Lachnoclostridium phytofermentans]ABX42348.1 ABC transporter related [Lachnoclostridium phytofermentans ISDg]